ncbi:ATP-binding cassette domain-containing protein [Treponema pedis]|uniref:ATP-binding cassette domain-containing protein n=1 Tax=Treponema pedis TaxID=409322 RepID=UPI00178C2093|nr:ABC transporter ATP-binding protein [Treponema pedis]
MLEYEYLEDSNSYDRIQILKKELLNKFLSKHTSLLSGFKILFQLTSIMIIVFSAMQFKGIIILLAVAAVVFISAYNGKKNYEQKHETAFLDRKADYYSDVLSKPEFTVERKIFNYAKYINKKFETVNKILISEEAKIKLKNMFRMESSSFFTLMIFIYFIISLSQSVVTGSISIGLLIATVKQLQNFLEIIRWDLYSILETKSEIKNYLNDLNEFYNYREISAASEISDINTEDNMQDIIKITDLNFAYPKTEKLVFKNLNFTFKKNKTYAIVGENGRGKSTLIKLLLGLYKDYEGEILLCGKPISQTPQKIISKKFSVVFQDYAHYYLTLKENILIGNLQANEDTIQQAISLFSLDKVLTSLNELAVLNKGDNFNADLSGGQWQNLALARSYIGNGEILIFDEPTASLSPMQETKIYTFLKDITKNKTAIFISHRLGIAPLVDEILLLKDGYILERGSHEELIANKSSVYYSMYNTQKELYV